MSRLLRLLCLALPFGALLAALPAGALPKGLAVSGALRTAAGTPVPDGGYALTFRLWNGPEATAQLLHVEPTAVQVQLGTFSLELGTTNPLVPLPAGLFAKQDVWLSVQVGTDPELPRQALQAVPYAHAAQVAQALACDKCLDGTQLAPAAVGGSHVAFAYAASTQKGGPAADLDCSGCVSAQEVGFAWALGTDKGGAALKAKELECTGCVDTAHLGLGAVTADRLHANALNWQALQGVPAGFADGADDTMTPEQARAAVEAAPVKLADGSTLNGGALSRLASATSDALADGAKLDLKVAATTPAVVAQAWFFDAPSGKWQQANTGADAVAGGCTACGSGKDGVWKPSSGTIAAGTYEYTKIEIAAGVTIKVTGSAPLILKATESAIIAGSLVLDGGDAATTAQNQNGCLSNTGTSVAGAGGPGGYGGGTCPYGGSASAGSGAGGGGGGATSSYGAGGGGGGHGTTGGSGGNGQSGVQAGAGGSVYAGVHANVLIGGSGGGAGGYGGAYNSAGAGGGGGGGVVKLEAPEISISGTISANGGKGGDMTNDCDGGAGGGGAGGGIWLRAGKISITGKVTASGGAGGDSIESQNSTGGDGGKGGEGQIRLDSPAAVVGSTTPAHKAGDATGLALPVVNRFAIEHGPVGTLTLTNKTGAPQKVWFVVSY